MARPEGWVFALLVVISFILLLWQVKWSWSPPATPRVHPKLSPRPLKPRTPADCPACCLTRLPGLPPASIPPKPYSQVKGPRGPLREKRIATTGFACPNPECRYYGITDDLIHALVGCGGHGSHEYIRDLKCQACPTTPALAGGAREFSVRYGTVLYRLKTPARRVGEVLSALAEGLSVGAAVRVFGHGEFTIRTWLTRAGLHAASLHERLFQNLKLLHVQLDELCTQTRQGADALWVWFAIDARTKIIPVLKVGPRTQPVAHAVVHALIKVLAPDCLPVSLAPPARAGVTSDGLTLYFYAPPLTSASGLRLPVGKLATGKFARSSCTANLSNITADAVWSASSAAALLGSPDQPTTVPQASGHAQRAPFRQPWSND